MSDEHYVGRNTWNRPISPYEQFMADEGIPVHRGIGFRDTRDLKRAHWRRMGGPGAFIELDGIGGLVGIYLIEIPGGGALNPEHHLYEEVFFVLEGRGATEIWIENNPNRQSFEWQAGSVFTAPLNTWHEIVNAGSSPALLLVQTNAPPIMQLFRNLEFLFNTPFHFRDRYDPNDDYFKPWQELGTDPLSQRALNAGPLIPDTVHCEVPADGQRGIGHRHFWLSVGHLSYGSLLDGNMQPGMGGNFSGGFIAQYAPGRYSKIHAHEPGPVLLCLSGRGYTLTWPASAGRRPWEAGTSDLVQRVDYGPGGLVSAAPGGSDWFHGHFPVSKEPLRVMAYLGGFPRRTEGAPGDPVTFHNEDIERGGKTIPYSEEDPHIRAMYEEALALEGARSNMPDEVYHPA
jgi:mannose-6-phosphate isomerase-like protein (cupin superfamily)